MRQMNYQQFYSLDKFKIPRGTYTTLLEMLESSKSTYRYFEASLSKRRKMSERIKMFMIHDLDQMENHLIYFSKSQDLSQVQPKKLGEDCSKINEKSETQVLKLPSADRPRHRFNFGQELKIMDSPTKLWTVRLYSVDRPTIIHGPSACKDLVQPEGDKLRKGSIELARTVRDQGRTVRVL